MTSLTCIENQDLEGCLQNHCRVHTLGIVKNINPNFSSVCTDAKFQFFDVSTTCLLCGGLFSFLIFFWLSGGHGLVRASKTHRLLLPKVSEYICCSGSRFRQLDHDKDWKEGYSVTILVLEPVHAGRKDNGLWTCIHFCIFVIFVNMNFWNCCKNGFFGKMFSTFTFNPSLCIF